MFQNWKKVCIFLIFPAFAAINISAQNDLNKIDGEVSKMLLKKDLRLAIKEAESSPANNLSELLRRLSLYQRAANAEKYTTTLKQIVLNADFEKSRFYIGGNITYALKSPLFEDYSFLQTYLQKVQFNDEVYGKFFEFCIQFREKCDIGGFDKFLEQESLKASKNESSNFNYYWTSPYFTWIERRIGWRERFGLDNSTILNQFVEDVRKNPADLDAAWRYLKFFKSFQDINRLAEIFASEQSFDYYELGETLSTNFDIHREPRMKDSKSTESPRNFCRNL